MTAVLVDLIPRPAPQPEVEIITDLEMLLAPQKCSCSSSDDQPY
ncbi:hypothetical protein ACFLIM_39325 [Nonomuraea sp. M3C6]|uniref:Transposase n=1 Tax=Nonomuraea marmarensis TaxID=3351344 RepID=A0ABW7APG0_9ACTN